MTVPHHTTLPDMKTPPVSPLEPFTRQILPSGLRLIVKEDHFTPIAAAAVWVGAGTADEDPEKNGLSHFFEHMLFKGTETRGVGEIDRQVTALGGYCNASTSHDFTDYYVMVPSAHIHHGIDILCDALLHSSFAAEEIENERRVILEEIHRQEDSPLGKLSDTFFEAAFRMTPYALPILGSVDTVRAISKTDFAAYRAAMYHPGNTVLVVTGDVSAERVVTQVEELFDSLPAGPPNRPCELRIESGSPPEPVILRKEVEETYLLLGYPVPDVVGTREEYALDVAAGILGDGRSSRLHRILREEKGIVSYIDCDFSAFRRAGLFSMEAGLEEPDLDEVINAIQSEIARIANGGFTDAELQRAKTLAVTGHSMSNQKVSSVAGTLGLYEIMGDVAAAVRYPEHVLAIRREEVADAVRKYCPADAYALAVLAPEGTGP
jgi:zinc protease